MNCEVCNGSGLPKVSRGAIWAFDAGVPLNLCLTCHGKGYVLVKKES